jgi:hypothetical protein
MISTLFTALALIATGQVRLPPAPPDLAPPPVRRPRDEDRRQGG